MDINGSTKNQSSTGPISVAYQYDFELQVPEDGKPGEIFFQGARYFHEDIVAQALDKVMEKTNQENE